MKKIVSIFLVTIYGMCMVACGSRSSSTEVKDNVLTEEEKAEGYPLTSPPLNIFQPVKSLPLNNKV